MMRPVQAAGTALKGNLKNLGGIAAREKAELTHRRPKQSRNRSMLRPCKMHRAGVIGYSLMQLLNELSANFSSTDMELIIEIKQLEETVMILHREKGTMKTTVLDIS